MAGPNTVEQLFNNFVLKCGGQLVASLLTGNTPRPNADYYFGGSGIIGELKCLQVDSFDTNYATKVQMLFDDWMRRRLLMVYGRVQVSLSQLNPICQKEWMDLIGNSLQKRFVEHANRQIKETKRTLNAGAAKGILFISSDGNRSLQPYDLMFFLDRTLKKKKKDGSLLYSNIDGIVYFSWTMPGHHSNIPLPIQFWIGVPRDPSDIKIKEFMDHLEGLWFEFLRTVTRQPIPRLVQGSIKLQDINIS